MKKYSTARDVIDLWPTASALAADLSEIAVLNISRQTVSLWRERNSINAKYDAALCLAAARRGFSLSLVDLMWVRSVALVKE